MTERAKAVRSLPLQYARALQAVQHGLIAADARHKVRRTSAYAGQYCGLPGRHVPGAGQTVLHAIRPQGTLRTDVPIRAPAKSQLRAPPDDDTCMRQRCAQVYSQHARRGGCSSGNPCCGNPGRCLTEEEGVTRCVQAATPQRAPELKRLLKAQRGPSLERRPTPKKPQCVSFGIWPCMHSRLPYSTQYCPHKSTSRGDLVSLVIKCCQQCQ